MQSTDRTADALEILQDYQDKGRLPLAEHATLSVDALALVKAVAALQTHHALFPTATAANPQVVVVGVSGGADSVCLLHLLRQLASTWHLDLHVAHLDHALRADSASDADFVQSLATTWQLPIHRERLAVDALAAEGGSIETAARQIRHQFLAQLAHSLTPPHQQPMVALAHHADDQAETLLHHLVRGSGLQGLGGMHPVVVHKIEIAPTDSAARPTTQLSSVTERREVVIQIVRPFLYVRRATILQYLRSQKLSWREDQTNLDQRYTRNYLRHTVLPSLRALNPAVVEALGRTATIAADEMARLTRYDQQLLAALQWPKTKLTAATLAQGTLRQGAMAEENMTSAGGRIVLDLTQLRALPLATQRALLRQAALLVAPAIRDLNFAQLTSLCHAIAHAESGGPHPLLADLMWSSAGATVTRPVLLSLHHRNVLPFEMGQPLLATEEALLLPIVPLGESAHLPLGNGWQLTVSHVARSELPADWQQRDQPWQAFFDSARVGNPMLTRPSAAQRFAPLGLAGHHKAVGDLFTDQKIPVAWRSTWPLLVNAATQEILWVCGLRPGHVARITAVTSTVICVTFDCEQVSCC